MLKTVLLARLLSGLAYHLGEGRVLKTNAGLLSADASAYHLGEGRVLKTSALIDGMHRQAYHLGEGRVLKTGQHH